MPLRQDAQPRQRQCLNPLPRRLDPLAERQARVGEIVEHGQAEGRGSASPEHFGEGSDEYPRDVGRTDRELAVEAVQAAIEEHPADVRILNRNTGAAERPKAPMQRASY